MRRALTILVLVLVATLTAAGAASAAQVTAAGAASAARAQCTVNIAPSVGSPTDVYRIAVSGVPVVPDSGIEVRVEIRLLGSRSETIYFAFLIPGATEFFIDHNQAEPGEPAEPLEPGRYLVRVTTPHIHGGCTAVGRFLVVH